MKRVYHPWSKWECYRAGFYETSPPSGMDHDEALRLYAEFLRDTPRFERALDRVISEWKHSCEHFLSNQNINRIAWLGQASMCIATGVPSCFRGGFKLLSIDERTTANNTAGIWLSKWASKHRKKSGAFTLRCCVQRPIKRTQQLAASTSAAVKEYIRIWRVRGYPIDIPDEVPERLETLGLAPSYRAICICLLQNDLHLTRLGFSAPSSKWYGVFKRIEIAGRETSESSQLELF